MSETRFKILLIDDDLDILDVLEYDLNDLGYDVLKASCAEGIEETIERNQDDLCLIISDYKMPDIDGLSLRRRLMPITKDIPYIILSGHVSKDMLKDALELKIENIIQKPSDIDEISDNIEKYTKDRKDFLEEKRFLKNIFTEESSELVEELEPLILDLEQDPSNTSHINSIFRLVHTIKGGSGVLEWADFTQYVHIFEDLLGKLKSKKIPTCEKVISVLLKGFDFLQTLVRSLKSQNRPSIVLSEWVDVFSLKNINEQFKSEKSASDEATENLEEKTKNAHSESIKVPCSILDEFMELSGEITVIKNTVNILVGAIKKELKGNKELNLLAEMIEEMNKINSSMQTKITELRKIPINNIYRSFPRAVRDIARKTGKKINLELLGESLRIDTSLHTVLSSSLIHVIRNCADHGIESLENRIKFGKDEVGHIGVETYEEGENIFVEVFDDGGGICPDKIKQIAIDKGLFTEEVLSRYTDNEIFEIIFEPGFSTASKITDVSGRGVGMDMVKTSVEGVGGKVIVESVLEQGTKFVFKLPIPRSVLIIHSLSVGVSNNIYFIPQDSISRIIKISEKNKDQLIKKVDGIEVISIEEELVPLVFLDKILELKDSIYDLNKDFSVVVVVEDGVKFGLVVESIIDSEEIVVKKLAGYLKDIGVFSGATFMGDGRVGIVLDISGIAKKMEFDNQKTASTHLENNEVIQKIIKRQSYLTFNLFSKGKYGVELKDVFRLEQIDKKDIKKISEKFTFIYREKVVEIIDLTYRLRLTSECKIEAKPLVNTFIVYKNKKYYAFMIESIDEIVEIEEQSFKPVIDRKEIIGNKIIHDNLVNIIDINLLCSDGIVSSSPKADVIPLEKAEKKDTENQDEMKNAAGWGEF